MRNKILVSVGAILLDAALALAQTPAPVPVEDSAAPRLPAVAVEEPAAPKLPAVNEPVPVLADNTEVFADDSRQDILFWTDMEYLLWHVRTAPVNVPLITFNPAGGPASTNIGAIGEAGTVVLDGASGPATSDFGGFSGARLTLGSWFNSERTVGMELNGFMLQQRDINFSASSNGSTVLSLPFTATQPFGFNPAGPTALSTGGAPNVITTQLTSELWGAEANSVFRLVSTQNFLWTGLIGFRHLNLNEGLTVNDAIIDPATAGGVVTVNDSFQTHNAYYGGQMGTGLSVTLGRCSLEVVGKIGVGCNEQSLDIAGFTTVANGAFALPTGTTPGGLFAEPTNMGHYARAVYAVVPQGQAKLSVRLTRGIQAHVGYDILNLSDALRPGNQVNSNINPSQLTVFNPPGTLTGPAAPVTLLQSSGFLVQGISAGIEIKF